MVEMRVYKVPTVPIIDRNRVILAFVKKAGIFVLLLIAENDGV